jgi:hypothetical protein
LETNIKQQQVMKNSKFYVKTPLKERLINFTKGLLFWRGRKKGMIHTRNITLNDLRAVFFPKDFYEKYKYLGSVPWNTEGAIFKAMEPLVIFMDYKAKPKYCPRWVLRFLYLFGSDNSIVRVRNRVLYNLKQYLTKGIQLTDYKTKWEHYDLRISVYGTDQIQNLADAIEHKFYDDGSREDLANRIKILDPNTKYTKGSLQSDLKKELNRLEDINETIESYEI